MTLLGRERHEIGREGRPYLTRWVIFGQRYGSRGGHKIYLNYFWDSDEEAALHDNPWPFWSLILWGGYAEVMTWPEFMSKYYYTRRVFRDVGKSADGKTELVISWFHPLSLLKRPANWAHRVVLHTEYSNDTGDGWLPVGKRNAISLVWVGAKERSCGWRCRQGWVSHREADAFADRGLNVCGDERGAA